MKEKRTRSVGGSVIPEPLTPYPYIATAFFTVIFVNTPLNPYLATGFKTRHCELSLVKGWGCKCTRSHVCFLGPVCGLRSAKDERLGTRWCR